MSSTSSDRRSTSATDRDHNPGRQGRDYTAAQAAAVNRVKKCRANDFYAVLDIESAATEGEIRKAYRKLALIMHPDKNGAPGADEAFKMVSKAFQILSDSDKKRIFDQTGADPDSRGGAGGSGFSRAAAAGDGGGGGMNGAQFGGNVSPEDIFNMFFGGGAGGNPFQAQFGNFGGPGVRIHTFGGGNPFQQQFRQARPAAANNNNQPPETLSSLLRLLPLLLLFITPLLSSFLNGSGSYGMTPAAHFEFNKVEPYTASRTTQHHNIPYFVNPVEVKDYTSRKFSQLDKRAEVSYIKMLRIMCSREYDYKQQKIVDSQGWFSVDQEAYEKAINLKLQNCDKLNELGVPFQN